MQSTQGLQHHVLLNACNKEAWPTLYFNQMLVILIKPDTSVLI